MGLTKRAHRGSHDHAMALEYCSVGLTKRSPASYDMEWKCNQNSKFEDALRERVNCLTNATRNQVQERTVRVPIRIRVKVRVRVWPLWQPGFHQS